jgi:signal transduction histidine kinase/DNA-binding response OmpR family regulator
LEKISQLEIMFVKLPVPRRPAALKKLGWMMVVLFISLLLAFVSCSQKNAQKKFRVGFSQCLGNDDWRRTMLAEMKRELSFHDNIEFLFRNAEANSDVQISQIQELVAAGIDLLIVCPNEVQPLTPVIGKLYDSGIPVVVVDRRIDSKKYTAFIGASNYEVGQNAGIYAASLLKGKGNIVEMAGLPAGASPPIDRHNGFMSIISNYPELRLVKLVDNLENEEKILRTNSGINLIYAQNDMMAQEAFTVCQKLGLEKRIRIIGIDGLPTKGGGLEMVDKGIIAATVLYPTGGQEAIMTAVNILEGKDFKKDNQLSTTIIDSSNIRITRLQNEKVIAQQADIDRRQQKIEEQEIVKRNQDRIINGISITLALSLIMGAILFYYLRVNKKITKRLAVQNEEILLQRNQLIELGKKAKEATDAKFNFFTNLSHELRTPLTLILGPAEEILSSPKLPVATRAQMEMMKKNAMRLLRLVNELMDFRKIEEAKMRIRASENDITAFVREITNAFSSTVARKKITFRVVSNAEGLKVWFDVNMLDKILFNLLSNALKYTGEHGFINVVISNDPATENVLIKVEDSGIGMEPETLEHAFDLFYQGDDGRYRGTGLGLALSKELIILHHGSITIKSEKGKGATFEIQLPLGKDHFEEADLEKTPRPYELNYEEARIFLNEAEPLALPYSDDEKVTAHSQSVLVIEDNPEIRLFITTQLSKLYDVIEAEDGNAGLELAFETVPDIIISDVLLPGKNGMLLMEILKNDIRTSHIPIILLTAMGSIEQQIDGLKLNADAYIVKPFNIRYLEQTMLSLLNNRELLKGHYTSEVAVNSGKASLKKIDRKFINEFSAIVENNISNEHFSVNDLCVQLGVSRVPLYRKVKAVMGYNINEYIMNVRLQKAKYLLRNEDLSISEISLKVGFASSTYFATVFKSKFGMTPKMFKEKGQVD